MGHNKLSFPKRLLIQNCIYFTGAVFIYGQIQLVFWWLSHVVSIMLIVFHPFKARSFLNTRKMKYIHAAITVVGLILPAMSPLIAVSSGANAVERKFGYGVVTYPPYICSNHNREVEFYTYILPLNLMVSSGLTCLVLLFWQLYKVIGYVCIVLRCGGLVSVTS